MSSPKPLSGIRVLELARILAGPWIGQTLADLGVVPSSMDKYSFDFLHRFRPGGHFTMVQGYH